MNFKYEKEFYESLKRELSDSDFELYLKSMELSDTHGFTLNLDKLRNSSIDIDYITNKFDAKLVFKKQEYAYFIYDKAKLASNSIFPGKDPLYHVGLYYIQEPSAASVLQNVEFNSGDKVLDLCASPGGKSVEALYNIKSDSGGFLLANEVSFKRAKILVSNLERMGFDNVAVICNEVEALSNNFKNYFDKIIVDAPCSGEGMFRKSEEARTQWSPKLVLSLSKLQKSLLEEACSMLKPGGIMIYSTCTFSREEDEEVIESLLSNHRDLKLLDMKKLFPFNSIGEGQFYAIITKDNANDYISEGSLLEKDLKNLNLLKYGIKKQNIVNGRMEPTHESIHNDSIIFENVIDLDDNEVARYLHGEAIRKDVSFDGFCKITYKNLGLGLAKCVKGVLKNHYPKGLRNF